MSGPDPIEVVKPGPPPPGATLQYDRNGVPYEHAWHNGLEVIIRYDDVPDSDRTVVRGIPVTTAERTIIDVAADCGDEHLDAIVRDAIDRELVTAESLMERASAPDLAARPGATLVRRSLRRLGLAPPQ